MSTPADSPVFALHRMYAKDMVLQQPNAPRILMETKAPKVDIRLGMAAEGIQDGFFEVCVTATINATIAENTLFNIEARQAGIFEIRNVPEDQLEAMVGIACPQMIYPYLRSTVSDICNRGGYPPVLLSEVDFRSMFEAHRKTEPRAA